MIMAEIDRNTHDIQTKISMNSNITLVSITAPNTKSSFNMNHPAPSYSVFPGTTKKRSKKNSTSSDSPVNDVISTRSPSEYSSSPIALQASTSVLNKDQASKRFLNTTSNKELQTNTYQPLPYLYPSQHLTDFRGDEPLYKSSSGSLNNPHSSVYGHDRPRTGVEQTSIFDPTSQPAKFGSAAVQQSSDPYSSLQRNRSEHPSSPGNESYAMAKNHKKNGSTNGDVLENVLGIYPEKKKLGVGVSVADVVANKLFRRSGQKTNTPFATPAAKISQNRLNSTQNNKLASRPSSSSQESMEREDEVIYNFASSTPRTTLDNVIPRPSYDVRYYSSDNVKPRMPILNEQTLDIRRHRSSSPIPTVVSPNMPPGQQWREAPKKMSISDPIKYDELEVQRRLLENRLRELQEERNKLVQTSFEPHEAPVSIQPLKQSIKPNRQKKASAPLTSFQPKRFDMQRVDNQHEQGLRSSLSSVIAPQSARASVSAYSGPTHVRNNSRNISKQSIQETAAIYSQRPLPPPPPANSSFASPDNSSRFDSTNVEIQKTNSSQWKNDNTKHEIPDRQSSMNLSNDSPTRDDVDEDDILGWFDDLKFAATGPPGQSPRCPLPYPTRAGSDITQVPIETKANYTYDVKIPAHKLNESHGGQQNHNIIEQRKDKEIKDKQNYVSTHFTAGTLES